MSEQKDTVKEELYYDQRSVALRTTQGIYFVNEHDKMSMLDLLFDVEVKMPTVMVVKSKKKADALAVFLASKGFTARAVHGNHREVQQKEVAEAFSLGTLDILITTDMILKTLDLENIKLLFSYDLPDDVQTYYNRLALMKEEGVGIALVSVEDEFYLENIEVNMKAEIEEKVLEGFVASALPSSKNKAKKDRRKKPRHKKSKGKREDDAY
ncbi:ATP-dependent RNA helicase RhlE [hydrothermal vent metagenome]|uniref:ATP-dependent RNA helicase RhlE n=1 Tax=hydrothermal vent metagenome TaxID=652676 RepID=A0A1W1BXQ4_9ZZZZ